MKYLIQADGKLPNLALMRLARYFRDRGEEVKLVHGASKREAFWPPGDVYGSSIFAEQSAELRRRIEQEWGVIRWGGTGVRLESSLAEVDSAIDWESVLPDYSIYPNELRSIGFTQRGCRLRCPFRIVPAKEGKVRAVHSIAQIWRGEPWPRDLLLLDNDFFGQRQWRDRVEEIRAGGFRVSFNQGINVRNLTDEQAAAIASVDYRDDSFKTRRIYTAWDNAIDGPALFCGLEALVGHGVKPDHIMVYMLVGFWPGETEEARDSRRRRLREFGARPYPMPYKRTPELLGFQRWVIGAYDKKIPWAEWKAARFDPRRLTRRTGGAVRGN